MREFDWLNGCVSCNHGCCHNADKYIPPNECARTGRTKGIDGVAGMGEIEQVDIQADIETYDRRPLECRLFPFDIRYLDGKAMWIIKNHCNETTRLDYEKFIGFFERKFFREIPAEQIMQYVKEQETFGQKNYSMDDPATIGRMNIGYIPIREVRWPSQNE